MIKLKDLICEPYSCWEAQSELVVDGNLSVQEAVQQMLNSGAESVSVPCSDDSGYAVLSREQLLEGLLSEMDQVQSKVFELQKQLESQLTDQIELMEVGAACIAENEKKKLRSAVCGLSEGMILMNASGQIEQVNESGRQMLDLSEGADLSEAERAIDKLGFRELMKVSEGLEDGPQGEFRVKSGSGRLLVVRWSQMTDEWDHCLGRALSLRDITDEVAAENTKNDFITAISHELRTPLTSIQNSVSNILAGVTGKVAGKTRQYLETMKGDCHRFADLINDLLDMAKLESGNMPISKRVMNPSSVVRHVCRDYLAAARESDVTLLCEVPDAVSPVYADVKRIRQVLSNLLSNALQFTAPGGTVTVGVCEAGGDVEISVKDTGVGISEDLQKLIFTKFYQVARQAGPGSKGSGLGLAISRGIVLAHGGSIRVESEPGRGSNFCFSLPKTDPDVILHRHLDSLIESAPVSGGRFGVVALRFGTEGDAEEAALHEAAGYVISEILAQSRFLLNCEMDLALQTGDLEVTFVVNSQGRQDLRKVYARLEKIVQKWIRKNFSELSILPMMAVAEYDETITNSEDLLGRLCETVSGQPLAR